MKRLLILQKMQEETKSKFIEVLSPYFEIDFADSFDPVYLKERIRKTEVCFGSFLPDAVLDAAADLEVFQLAGTGVDKLNLKRFREKGIKICKTQAHSKYVAEFAVAMLHCLVKKVALFDRLLRINDAQYIKSNMPGLDFSSHTLFEKRIGIIGYGNIGKYIHRLLVPYTAHFFINAAEPKDVLMGGKNVTLEDLIRESDIVFIACPLTLKTKGLIEKNRFKISRHDSVWINISRGEIIDFDALVDALEEGAIGGVAMDNWYPRRPEAQKQLSKFDNVVLSPYRATNISEGNPNIDEAMHNLARLGRGEELRNEVNYEKGY